MLKNLDNFINHLLAKKNIIYQEKVIIFQLLEEILYLNLDFIKNNIEQIMFCDLNDDLFNYSYEIIYNKYIEQELYKSIFDILQEKFIILISLTIELSLSIIYKFIMPKREYNNALIRYNNNKSINLSSQYIKIKNRLEILKNIKQPEQRSDEWYVFRNSILTASNIWKVFISESSQNQLVLEKCEPIDINKFKVTNLNSPLHWGQKYEPVSTMYYEYKYKTQVTEFGCIRHDKYSFIAASPDGIICDDKSDLFGRMLEIKNVVSREITGIPKMEYWIQMQIQMEVCDLNECDFLETKFIEYENYEEYLNDKTDKYKGIILLYFTPDNNPHYEYVPFNVTDISSNEYANWFNKINNENNMKNNIFEKFIYWRLDVISCILILRHKLWFSSILPLIDNFWKNLLEERESGKYKERIKKKRKLDNDDVKSYMGFSEKGCLLNLQDDTKSNIEVVPKKCLLNLQDEPIILKNSPKNNPKNSPKKKTNNNFVIDVIID